jgi:hypothetical protein
MRNELDGEPLNAFLSPSHAQSRWCVLIGALIDSHDPGAIRSTGQRSSSNPRIQRGWERHQAQSKASKAFHWPEPPYFCDEDVGAATAAVTLARLRHS